MKNKSEDFRFNSSKISAKSGLPSTINWKTLEKQMKDLPKASGQSIWGLVKSQQTRSIKKNP